jgi:hypothetical protein
VRVRFGTNDPTPWPPELPAGENPLPGGIIDYSLATDASEPVTLDIVDAAGKVVRHYSSDDRVRDPNPALDPVAYDKVCQQTPTAPDCALPLYWPAKPIRLSTRAGFHRFTWDLHYDAIGEDPTPAMRARTARFRTTRTTCPYSPWAPPGQYTARLTVDGKQYTQPITLRLDPRVKTSAAGSLASSTASRVRRTTRPSRAHTAFEQARALMPLLDTLTGATLSASRRSGGARARDAPVGRRRGLEGHLGGAPAPLNLESASNAMMVAAMAMQGADVAPTARQVATACQGASRTAGDPDAGVDERSRPRAGCIQRKRQTSGQPPVDAAPQVRNAVLTIGRRLTSRRPRP